MRETIAIELKKKNRESYRAERIKAAKEHGVYNGEKQLFSQTGNPALCTRVKVRTENAPEEILSTFNDLQSLFSLRQIVIDDFKTGQIDISYVDKNENAQILHLEDDPEFVKKADELRSYGVIPFHGIKWDGQASPVFLCLMDMPDTLGDSRLKGYKLLPSGSASAGISVRGAYRYNQVGVYFWIDDVLYDDYAEMEGHNGVLYPVTAFPDLQEKDGIRIDDITII